MISILGVLLYLLLVYAQGWLWYHALLNDFGKITVGSATFFSFLSLLTPVIVLAFVIWASSDGSTVFSKILVMRK